MAIMQISQIVPRPLQLHGGNGYPLERIVRDLRVIIAREGGH